MSWGGDWQSSNFTLVLVTAGGKFSGLFVYSPAPGKNNLVASTAAAAGTDPFGNPYQGPGTYIYETGDATTFVGLQAGATPELVWQLNQSLSWTLGGITPAIGSSGQVTFATSSPAGQQGLMTLTGGTTPGLSLLGKLSVLTGADIIGASDFQTSLVVGAASATTTALLEVAGLAAIKERTGPGTPAAGFGFVYANSNDTFLHYKDQSGFDGTIPGTEGDGTVFTITQTGNNQATKAWTIPANNAAAADTIYRVKFWGAGTNGTTVQNLTIGFALNGATIRTTTKLPPGATSGALRFSGDIVLHVKTTGAGGTCDVGGCGSLDATGTVTGAQGWAIGSAAAGGEAFNTTVSNTVGLTLGWASTTGAPTISVFGSVLERIGP